MIHDMLDLVMPTTSTSASLCFGYIDAAGQVFLEPGDTLISPPPPSLVTLQPSNRFAGILQGREGGAQTLLVVGLIGGGPPPPPPIPVGSVQAFAGSSAPGGWLLCQGQAVSRTTYADLFSVIGTTYGAGNGSTSFNIPDYRGRALVGVDSGQSEFSTLGQVGGAKTHTLTKAQMPAHEHSNTMAGIKPGSGTGSFGGFSMDTYWNMVQVGGTLDAYGSGVFYSGSQGGGGAHNNLQPYRTAQFIIKT